MESDNRVIINCGGIRHETYKAELPTKFRESFHNNRPLVDTFIKEIKGMPQWGPFPNIVKTFAKFR